MGKGGRKFSLGDDTSTRNVGRGGSFATAKLLATDVRCVLVHVTPGYSAARQTVRSNCYSLIKDTRVVGYLAN
jgi:hypothetical protein